MAADAESRQQLAEIRIAIAADRAAAGDVAGAIGALRAAAAIAPESPLTAIHMADIDAQILGGNAARRWLDRVVALAPGLAATEHVLARVLRIEGFEELRLGRSSTAGRRWHGALALDPQDGATLLELAHLRPATVDKERLLHRALAIRSWAGALNNLGNAAKGADRLTDAVRRYRQALAEDPANAFAFNNVATTLRDQAELAQAIFCYRCALAIDPGAAATESNFLQALQFDPSIDDADIAAFHRRWAARHAGTYRGNSLPPLAARTSVGSRLRIGYVSADLRAHPVGFFLLPVLESRNRRSFHVTCYATRKADDEIATALRAATDDWVDAAAVGDAALAERVRADRIDILVDLSGHTAHHRLLVFARRPAAIQVTWLGYFDTTGLSAIDYLLTDAWEVPAGHDDRFTEQVVRLPAGRFAWRPPSYAPATASAPSARTGSVTFGSFNNLGKLTEPAIRLWARVLMAVPTARLLLKWSSLADPAVAAAIHRRFAGHGADPRRVELRGASTHPAMLAEYGDVDIALDPFPFSGCLTTVEALWMGVPVVALAGGRPVARQSAAILWRLGLDELVARDGEEYVERAVHLADAASKRQELRSGMRRRMAESTLVDGRAVAASVEDAYRAMAARQRGETVS